MFAKSLVRAAVLVALTVAFGCSRGGTFATVSGVITHNGTPIEGAKVTFYSTVESEGKAGTVCSAQTDSSGKYVIAMLGKDPGIPPGMYKVTVVKYEGGFSPQDGMDAGQMEAMLSDTGGSVKSAPRNLLPKEYATLATSKLSSTLEAGKNKDVNFDLKGK
jgi:hypothetical protein